MPSLLFLTLSFSDILDCETLTLTHVPSLHLGLLFQLGYVERADDMGVVALPHPLHLLPISTMSTKTRASANTKTRATSSTGTRASTNGGLVLHVCVLGAVGVDTVGLVRAMSNLSTAAGQRPGLGQGPSVALSFREGRCDGVGEGSGDDGVDVVGTSDSNGASRVGDSEIGVTSHKQNHTGSSTNDTIDNNNNSSNSNNNSNNTNDTGGSMMAVVHGSCPWQIANDQGLGQGLGQGLNQGQRPGLSEGSSPLALVTAESTLAGDKTPGIGDIMSTQNDVMSCSCHATANTISRWKCKNNPTCRFHLFLPYFPTQFRSLI